jgi:chemotaxis signal transduction protein
MAAESLLCLFRCAPRSYAVPVASVAGVIDVASLVRIGLCPPRIVGLCPYRREVIPVVDFGVQERSQVQAAGERASAATAPEVSVLIVQIAQGSLGIRVDRSRTRISAERVSRHEPTESEEGVTSVGVVRHDGAEHSLIDVEATWERLRADVSRRYARALERIA